MKPPPKTPPELDRIVDAVLAYRPAHKKRKLREKKVRRGPPAAPAKQDADKR